MTAARHLPIVIEDESSPSDVVRPRTRGECRGGIRPCPWAACRFHLALHVSEKSGRLFEHPNPDALTDTCCLDVADRGEATEDQIAALLGLSRQAVNLTVLTASEKLRHRLDPAMLDEWVHAASESVADEGFDFIGPDFKAAVSRAYERIVPAHERGTQMLRGKPPTEPDAAAATRESR